MNIKEYQQLYLDIRNFLAQYRQIWDIEVLQHYPHSLDAYSLQWIDQLDKLKEDELWKLDGYNDYSLLSEGELKQLFLTLESFTNRLPHYNETQKPQVNLIRQQYNDRTFYKVKDKKRHEIERLTPIIDQLHQQFHYQQVVDIGGGQGHLARILTTYHQLPATTIDYCKEFQEIGQKKLHKYPHQEQRAPLTYCHHHFGQDIETDAKLLPPDTLTVGLHTCGPLALSHLNAFKQGQATSIINFGCCYLKMDPQKDINLSKFVQQNDPLPLSDVALTLATRSHGDMTFKRFQLKTRVKLYRNMLHLLLGEIYNRWDFISVGDSPPKDYYNSFYNYVVKKFHYLNYPLTVNETTIEEFFNDPTRQKLVRRMFLADLIRWKFGRALEFYILLDRLFYMAEEGYMTELVQVFAENISPRNIALIAHRLPNK